MGAIKNAGAWCNGEVGYIAWQVDQKIPDCLGFMITRVHETGPDAPARRVLPTWIAFTDQSNPDLERTRRLGMADPGVRVARPDAAQIA